jgi:hypothetical protein
MTTSSLTAALLVTAALGISFRTTRGIGIGAFAGLCALHPWLAFLVLAGIALLAYHLLLKR